MPRSTRIEDDLVQRLINRDGTESLVFYDVSDCQLYGRRHNRRLAGALASGAESAGCIPIVYQAVHWFCLVYMPVWPLGTYVVIPERECDDPDGDADQYRDIRIATDRGQIAFQYSVLVTVACCVAYTVRQLVMQSSMLASRNKRENNWLHRSLVGRRL